MTEIDSEDDASVTSSLLTSDSHMCNKSCSDLRHIPSLEAATLHDHSRMPVDQPNDKFEVNDCTHLAISYLAIHYLYRLLVIQCKTQIMMRTHIM